MNVSTSTSPPATRLQVLPFAALVALLKRHPNLWNKMRSVEFWKLWLSLSSVHLSCMYCQNWRPPPAFYFKLPGQQNNARHIYRRTYLYADDKYQICGQYAMRAREVKKDCRLIKITRTKHQNRIQVMHFLEEKYRFRTIHSSDTTPNHAISRYLS